VELITNAANSNDAVDYYAVKETNVISDADAYGACSPNNSILKYNFEASSGSITAVRQCIQPCNLESTNAIGCREGYYLADNNNRKYVKDTGTAGTLYQCVKGSDNKFKCSVVANPPLGYLVNAGNQVDTEDVPYIKCEVSNDAATVCKPYTPDAVTDCATGTSVGAIISNVVSGTTTYSICVATTAGGTIAIGTRASVEEEPNLTITVDTTTTVSYMISDVMYKSDLNDSKFIIIDLAKGNITINQEANPIRYQYTDANQKIYTAFVCTVNNGANTITITTPASQIEYKLDDDDPTDTIYYFSQNV